MRCLAEIPAHEITRPGTPDASPQSDLPQPEIDGLTQAGFWGILIMEILK